MSATSYPPPPRGVWTMPYRDELGRPIAVAISSDGRKLCEVSIRDPRAIPEIEMQLWEILDHEDPAPARPRLELIRVDARPMEAQAAPASGGQR